MNNTFINMSDGLARNIKLHMLANKTYSKVFGIGANKTGTTTLERVLKDFGLNMPRQELQIASIFNQVKFGNYREVKNFVDMYDAFQDQPFSSGINYAVVDALFPGSKFILTVREPEAWFDSLLSFTCSVFNVTQKELNEKVLEKSDYCFRGFWKASVIPEVLKISDYTSVEDWSLFLKKDHFIQSYSQRNSAVIHYFRERPDDLLVIDLTKEETTRKINEFLGIPKEYTFKMPHLNQSF